MTELSSVLRSFNLAFGFFTNDQYGVMTAVTNSHLTIDTPTREEYLVRLWHPQVTASEAAESIRHTDDQSPPEHFDKDLLMQQIGWARKSKELLELEAHDEFDTEWVQSTWARTPEGKVVNLVVDERVPSNCETVILKDFCGTSACIAGNIALQRGEVVWTREAEDEDWEASGVKAPDGQYLMIGDFARDQLGLTRFEAGLMFAGSNSIERLETFAEAFCIRRGVDW